MPSRWDLNAIVLAHSHRFFSAATRAVGRWLGRRRDRSGSLVALAGNVLWAQSPFISRGKGEEETLALLGAVTGTLADRVVGDGHDGRELLAVVGDQERQLRLGIDDVVDRLHRDLGYGEVVDPGPAHVDRWVWRRLFPAYPYELSTLELETAILERLDASTRDAA